MQIQPVLAHENSAPPTVDAEGLEGPFQERQVGDPVGDDGQRADVDVEAAEDERDNHHGRPDAQSRLDIRHQRTNR